MQFRDGKFSLEERINPRFNVLYIFSQVVNDENPCGATGKRKLETVHYEDSIMAMKCRKFEKGDSYSTKESEST